MALVSRLQDVEQQLLRTTQVIQLHVRLADTLVNSKSPSEYDSTEILGLIEGVERAQRGLQTATTQLLVLAKCCVPQTTTEEDEEDIKTENVDKEGLKFPVTEDQCETTEENAVDSVEMPTVHMEDRSSLEKYTAVAKNAMKMVIDPEDAETIEAWRRIVEVNGLDANREFIDLLSEGKVEEEVVENFLNATTFAVSVLTSYQAMSQKSSWLMQLVEDITDVANTAKDSKFATILAPLEKCRDDLVAYCSHRDRDTLEDMSNYVILIERHRGIQANELLPYLLTLLRKFICDCTDYRLREDIVGETPRTDSDWVRFAEVGIALANWMQILWESDVKCSNVDALLVSSYFRAFEARFPGKLPVELHENWIKMIGESGNGIEVRVESVSQTEPRDPIQCDKKRSSTAKEIPITKGTNVKIPISHELRPLEKFISVTKEAKSELESIVLDHTFNNHHEVMVGKWSTGLKEWFQWAHSDFCACVSRGDNMNIQTVIDFREATEFVVSLMTTHDIKEFSRAWIIKAIKTLDATHNAALQSEFSETLQPFLEYRNELIKYCDKRFPDSFDGVSESVKIIGQVESAKAGPEQLKMAVLQFGRQFHSICSYKMFRHKIRVPLIWTQETWQKFSDVGLVLSHWLKRVGNALAKWMVGMSIELHQFNAMFPGRVPNPLLSFYKKEKTTKKFKTATSRIHGTRPYPKLTTDNAVTRASGAKRARTDSDGANHPPKHKPPIQTTPSADPTTYEIDVKLRAHLRAGKTISTMLNNRDIANAQSAKRCQKFLIQSGEINAKFLAYLRQGNVQQSTRETFDQCTKTLADVVWHSPIEWIPFPSVKTLLDGCTEILQVSAAMGNGSQINMSLSASCKSLQQYWGVHYANIVQTMRNYVAETNTLLGGMDYTQLGFRVRQLVLFYRNACDVCFSELNAVVSFSRKHDLQVEMMEVGAGLNRWIERVLAEKIRVQRLVNFYELDMKITRLSDALPGSVPPPLIKNIRQVFAPRDLRPLDNTQK